MIVGSFNPHYAFPLENIVKLRRCMSVILEMIARLDLSHPRCQLFCWSMLIAEERSPLNATMPLIIPPLLKGSFMEDNRLACNHLPFLAFISSCAPDALTAQQRNDPGPVRHFAFQPLTPAPSSHNYVLNLIDNCGPCTYSSKNKARRTGCRGSSSGVSSLINPAAMSFNQNLEKNDFLLQKNHHEVSATSGHADLSCFTKKNPIH